MRADFSASDYFGAMADSYDSLIRRSVPRYDEMTDRLVDYLDSDATRALELGCGTGNLTLHLAVRLPNAALTLVDASSEMIAVTRARLDRTPAAEHPRRDFVMTRFEDLAFQAESFDLVVSSISLHHVKDKASLYKRIHGFLRTGGQFCFADQIRGEPESNHQVNWRNWLEFCAEPRHCTPKEIENLLQHSAAHDHYTTLSDHFALLEREGFAELDCVWRNGMWGIVTAVAA